MAAPYSQPGSTNYNSHSHRFRAAGERTRGPAWGEVVCVSIGVVHWIPYHGPQIVLIRDELAQPVVPKRPWIILRRRQVDAGVVHRVQALRPCAAG